MRSRSFAGAFVLAVITTVGAVSHHDSPLHGYRGRTSVCNGGVGFSEGSSIGGDSDGELERRIQGMKNTGAGWLRVDVRWPDVQPRRGSFHWGSVDRIVDAARSHGLEVLATLDYTPAWARPRGTTEKHPPTKPRPYATFAAAAARHFAGRVRAFEIWNEPNSAAFWEGGANPAAYVRLLDAAYSSVKRVDRRFLVITGGTAPASTGKGWISPVEFLNGIYAAEHFGHHFDAVAHHAYHWPYLPSTPEVDPNLNSFGLVTPLLHLVMAAHGDGTKRIWLTETGAPVPAARYGVTTTRRYLAAYIKDAFALVRSSAWKPWIGPIFWYSYRDRGTDRSNFEDMFGLVTRDFRPKHPALEAFVAAVKERGPRCG